MPKAPQSRGFLFVTGQYVLHGIAAMSKTQLPELSIARQSVLYKFHNTTSWGIRDPERFNALLDEAAELVEGGYYLGDNFFTWMRNLSVLEDIAFRESWESNLVSAADEAILWRRYILCCAAFHCVHLEGDFVECGVLYGTGVKTVIDYFGKEHFHKSFWAYDTFDSNPVDGHAFPGQQEGLYEQVRERFVGYEQVHLIKGMLPDTLVMQSPERIAYLHIDLNKAEYEVAVLDILFDRVVPGGVVILDDYEWAGIYRNQKIQEDIWFSERSYRVFPLPTGQGLVLKR